MIKLTRWVLVLLAVAMALPGQAIADDEATTTKPRVLCDVTHVYGFFYAWKSAIGKLYLTEPGQDMTANHRTISTIDWTNYNVFWVPLGSGRDIPYFEDDVKHVETFVRDGGTVLFFQAYNRKDEELKNENRMLKPFGVQLTPTRIEGDVKLTDAEPVAKVDGFKPTQRGHILNLDAPADWTVLATDSKDRPVLVTRKVGKGRVTVSGACLFGRPPKVPKGQKQDPPPNHQLIQALIGESMVAKPVPDVKLPFKLPPEKEVPMETMVLYCSAYMEPLAEGIGKLYEDLQPNMRKWMGVPLAATNGKKLKIHLLATGGGGWSTGSVIGLGAFWGGWPAKRAGMIGLVGHELNHSWVIPHAEVLGNEGIAIYAGGKMAQMLARNDDERKEADDWMEKKVKSIREHKAFTKYDPVYPITPEIRKECGPVLNGKYIVILYDLETKYGDGVVAKYFQLKRELVPDRPYRFTAHDSAWLWSKATGDDIFTQFNEIGITADPDKVTIPAAKNDKAVSAKTGT